ncbi:hypothetical protein C8R44DRAFT_984747 [Mycena epipterygia]|nr:hypothetical protein C8R44DRAFT_984747 [Mycena epipterygia]
MLWTAKFQTRKRPCFFSNVQFANLSCANGLCLPAPNHTAPGANSLDTTLRRPSAPSALRVFTRRRESAREARRETQTQTQTQSSLLHAVLSSLPPCALRSSSHSTPPTLNVLPFSPVLVSMHHVPRPSPLRSFPLSVLPCFCTSPYNTPSPSLTSPSSLPPILGPPCLSSHAVCTLSASSSYPSVNTFRATSYLRPSTTLPHFPPLLSSPPLLSPASRLALSFFEGIFPLSLSNPNPITRHVTSLRVPLPTLRSPSVRSPLHLPLYVLRAFSLYLPALPSPISLPPLSALCALPLPALPPMITAAHDLRSPLPSAAPPRPSALYLFPFYIPAKTPSTLLLSVLPLAAAHGRSTMAPSPCIVPRPGL